MSETFSPEIDIEQLMQRIRDEVARRKQSAASAGDRSPPTCKTFYTLDEFLRYDDREFLINAYRGLLQREPDDEGLQCFLDRLRSGSSSKIDILRDIRYSPEGTKTAVQIPGLLPPTATEPRQKVAQANLEEFQTAQSDGSSAFIYLEQKSFYTLGELLQFRDKHFIRNAFLTLLHREPDSSGLQHYLIKLREGALTKVDILGRLHYSREGRLINTKIKGLLAPFIIQSAYHIPVLGNLMAVASLLLRSSALIRRLRAMEAQNDYRHTQTDSVAGRITRLAKIVFQAQTTIQEFATQQRVEITQLKLLADAKTNRIELTDLEKNLRDFVHTKMVTTQVTDTLAQLKVLLNTKANTVDLEQATQQLRTTLDAKTDALEQATQQLRTTLDAKTDTAEFAPIKQQAQSIGDLHSQLHDHKRTILDQQRRLGLLLEEVRKRLPEPLNTEQLTVVSDEQDHLLDAMYATFEDQFRGTRKDIKDRQRVYLPVIRECGAGTAEAPVLDIGCGRGEWLELLRDNQLTGLGVDLNRVFVQQCRTDGLNVIEQDALTYLHGLPNNTLGALTGFHIIEHLPLKTLITLFDETLRVLQPGGVAIFETPNPENLVVGACNFYMDPTHRNPLPPAMSQFLAEARGFVRCEIRRINQLALSDRLRLLEPGTPGAVELNPLIHMTNEHYFTAPDYAVIGYKA